MPDKLAKKDMESILSPLPAKDRNKLMAEELTPEKVKATLARTRELMKRDLWIGLPWFISYSVALFTKGIGFLSVSIFVVGMIYFITTALTSGSYGLNRKREKVFEKLLQKMGIDSTKD